MSLNRVNIVTERKRSGMLFLVVVLYQMLVIAVLVGTVKLVWDKEDWLILWVPLSIWQWSLLGAVAGVVHQICFRQVPPEGQLSIYLWALGKPLVGTAMGGLVYFLAKSGNLVLTGYGDVKNTELLCALCFVAGFSDRFSVQVIERLMGNVLKGAARRGKEK